MARPVFASLCALLLGMLVIGVLTIGDVGIVFLAIALLGGAFIVGLSLVTIRIDEDGTTACSRLCFSTVEASLLEIESASTRDVKAVGGSSADGGCAAPRTTDRG